MPNPELYTEYSGTNFLQLKGQKGCRVCADFTVSMSCWAMLVLWITIFPFVFSFFHSQNASRKTAEKGLHLLSTFNQPEKGLLDR